jgi:hypothetical protein
VHEVINTGLVVLLVGSAAVFVGRFLRSRGRTRQQFKPLLLVVAVAVLGLGLQVFPLTAPVGVTVLVISVAVGVPVAIATAVLQHQLWDLDGAIVATLVYGGLALGITVVYVGIVVGAGILVGHRGPPLPCRSRPRWSWRCCSVRRRRP